MRLIDTNVVIYAAGKAHPLQDEARKVLDRIAEGSLHANVDVELLQEILHVYAARKERAKGFDTIDDLLVLFPNPIAIGREEVETARDGKFVSQFADLVAQDGEIIEFTFELCLLGLETLQLLEQEFPVAFRGRQFLFGVVDL